MLSESFESKFWPYLLNVGYREPTFHLSTAFGKEVNRKRYAIGIHIHAFEHVVTNRCSDNWKSSDK